VPAVERLSVEERLELPLGLGTGGNSKDREQQNGDEGGTDGEPMRLRSEWLVTACRLPFS
jgi:hypothetical protein